MSKNLLLLKYVMMRRYPIALTLLVTVLTMSIVSTGTSAKAQNPVGVWTPFVDISNTPTASTYPCIAADAAGNVHVVWSEDVGGKTRNLLFNPDGSPMLDARGNQVNTLTESGDTLYYTRWDGEKWIDPIDVQINPGGLVQYPRITVDLNGILHMVWASAEGRQATLVYSQVPASKAEIAHQWSDPIMLVESMLYAYYPTDIVTDPTGGLHVLYSQIGAEPGAYIINSSDGGNSWSTPVELYRTVDSQGSEEGISTTRLVADQKGRLHAVWTQFGSDGNGSSVFYSQSQDLGQTWSTPMQVAAWRPGWYEVDWLSVGVAEDEIHLVWEGSSSIAALNERISTNGGLTWSEPRQILSALVGENGFADLVVDSANQMHMLMVKRGDAGSITNGIWYTVWDRGDWRSPILLGISNPGLYSQLGQLSSSALQAMLRGSLTGNGLRYQQAAIVNGNELFVVVVNEWDGDIWSTHTTLDAPRIIPQPYPQAPATPTPAPVLAAQPVSTPVPTRASPPGTVVENQDHNVSDPILVGSLPVLLLIAVAFVYVRVVRRINA